MNEEALQSLTRHDLQLKAKELGIKANLSSSMIIQQIMERMNKSNEETEVINDSVNSLESDEPTEKVKSQLQESEESVYISDGESNLVENLNRILDGESRVSIQCNSSKIHSDVDTLTLQDILNRDDTTFIGTNESIGGSNEIHSNGDNANQSRMPSLSKNIISMLIDMDNENYSKKTADGSTGKTIEEKEDSRLSQTVISDGAYIPSAKKDNTFFSEDTVDLASQLRNGVMHEEINPTTCFDNYTDEELSKLCTFYKNRVMHDGSSEDMEILLNINSTLSDRITKKETVVSVKSHQPLLREGSLVVIPRLSAITTEAVKQDTWEKGAEVVEDERDGSASAKVIPQPKEEEEEVPVIHSVGYDPNMSPIRVNRPEYHLCPPSNHYRSKNRKTIISASRLKEIEEGIPLPEDDSLSDDHLSCEDEDEGLTQGEGDERVTQGEGSERLTQGEGDERVTQGEGSERLTQGEGDERVIQDEDQRRLTQPTQDKEEVIHPSECTYIQVDIDLDNPAVSEDDEDAQSRFYHVMEKSLDQVQGIETMPPFIEKVHELIRKEDPDYRRESLIRGIADSVEKAKRSFRVSENSESKNSVSGMTRVSDIFQSIQFKPLKRECEDDLQNIVASKRSK